MITIFDVGEWEGRPYIVMEYLGGGSLELIDVHGSRVSSGVTLPLGSLALQDLSHKSLKRAERIVSNDLSNVAQLKASSGRTFYAVGGTWRALARIHILQSGYPLRVMHGYSLPAADALDFARRLRRLAAANMLADIEVVADARRPLHEHQHERLSRALAPLAFQAQEPEKKRLWQGAGHVRVGSRLLRRGPPREDARHRCNTRAEFPHERSHQSPGNGAGDRRIPGSPG